MTRIGSFFRFTEQTLTHPLVDTHWLTHYPPPIFFEWAVAFLNTISLEPLFTSLVLSCCTYILYLSHTALMKSTKWCCSKASCMAVHLASPSLFPSHSHRAVRQLHLILRQEVSLFIEETFIWFIIYILLSHNNKLLKGDQPKIAKKGVIIMEKKTIALWIQYRKILEDY